MKKIILSVLLLMSFHSTFASLNKIISEEFAQKILTSDKNYSVIVFMNRLCPCTNHNIDYLNDLSKKYSNLQFLGIHAVKNTKDELVADYKKLKNLNFNLINDSNLFLADELEANRTPQVFIIHNQSKKILYVGGVTDRTNPNSAENHYLKNALDEIMATNTLIPVTHRSLGCAIVR